MTKIDIINNCQRIILFFAPSVLTLENIFLYQQMINCFQASLEKNRISKISELFWNYIENHDARSCENNIDMVDAKEYTQEQKGLKSKLNGPNKPISDYEGIKLMYHYVEP